MKTKEPKFQMISVENLVKAGWNYKDNDDEMAKKLLANIKRNGQVESILVREIDGGENFEVINGNHRFDAICELGIKEVMACNIGKISDAAAKRLAIEMNETAFPTDLTRLSGILVDVTKEFGEESLETLPYTEKQLNKLLSAGSWSTIKEGKKEKSDEDMIILKIGMTFEQNEEFQNWKLQCGTESDALAFAKAVEAALSAN